MARWCSVAVVLLLFCAAQARRVYRLNGGGLILSELARYTYPAEGCYCTAGPSSGQCCHFANRVPDVGSKDRASCNCRPCKPKYQCVSGKAEKYCVPKRFTSVPRLVGKVYRPGAATCVNKWVDQVVLMPRSNSWKPKSGGWQKKLKTRKKKPRKKRLARVRRRPKKYALYVAGGDKCWVYHGASKRPILKTTQGQDKVVYERKRLGLKKCAPIRLKCVGGRRGVLVALKAGGLFYGSGLKGTRCVASSRRPKNWHSDNPKPRDETQVVRSMPTEVPAWQEMTELTNARPVRPRRRAKFLFTYIVIFPPLCGDDFDGPVW